MTLTTFQTVLANLLASRLQPVILHLNWRGEPVLNPALPQMLALLYERAPTWPVQWHTNGTALGPAQADALVDAHPEQTIFVSLDGGDRQTFEENRGAGRWRSALRGLELLLAARGNRARPRIGVYQLNLGLLPTHYDPRFVDLLSRVDTHVVVDPVELDGNRIDAPRVQPSGPCFWLGNTLAVGCDGSAWTCLLHTGTRIGSLLEEPADALLDRAGQWRTQVARSGRQAMAGCARCLKPEGAAVIPPRDKAPPYQGPVEEQVW